MHTNHPGKVTGRAVAQTWWGGPGVLQMFEVSRSVPGAGEVLVWVHAPSMNARDWHVVRGEPQVARLMERIRAFCLTIEPSAQQYLLQPAGDDAHAVRRQAGRPHSRWHHLGHTATSVAARRSQRETGGRPAGHETPHATPAISHTLRR